MSLVSFGDPQSSSRMLSVSLCLCAYMSVCLSVTLSVCLAKRRYVKNSELDKDQHTGRTESHKDVQCLEVEGGRGWTEEEEDGGWRDGGRRVRGWSE